MKISGLLVADNNCSMTIGLHALYLVASASRGTARAFLIAFLTRVETSSSDSCARCKCAINMAEVPRLDSRQDSNLLNTGTCLSCGIAGSGLMCTCLDPMLDCRAC